MERLIIILSGHICCGKSELSTQLAENCKIYSISTSTLLKNNIKKERDRKNLQVYGAHLDKKTKGKWLANELGRLLIQLEVENGVVLDCARRIEQINEIRKIFNGYKVIHVHLTANEQSRKQRYQDRELIRGNKSISFDDAMNDETERQVETLAPHADLVVDTERCTSEDVFVRVASRLGFYGKGYERNVDVMVGGQFGSEGKGHLASYLAPEYQVLVRVGGPNAGHTVYTPEGNKVFHHLPSGSWHNRDAKLIIGAGATIFVDKILEEINEFEVSSDRIFIDPQAMIITKSDQKAEASLVNAIASTQQGVGVATARRIRDRGNYPKKLKLAKDIKDLRCYVKETREVLDEAFRDSQKVFLEGTQGTALSLYHGEYPYVTSRDTTVTGCLAEAGISASRIRRVIMVCRTYPIRVQNPPGGTSGPMSLEIDWETISERSGIALKELKRNEKTSTTNRERRVSEFDWRWLRKASSLNAPTDIALTFVDYLDIENSKARQFKQLKQDTINFIEDIERVARAPVSLISTRFDERSILDRRNW